MHHQPLPAALWPLRAALGQLRPLARSTGPSCSSRAERLSNAAAPLVAPADGYPLLAACVCSAISLLASRCAGVSGRDVAPLSATATGAGSASSVHTLPKSFESLSAAKQLRRLPAACATLLAQPCRACIDFPRAMLMFTCDLCPD